ncbi:hypothetical protein [Parerythrobacter lacustris]|uniref:Uracil-DNA glycosylase-like domain-containing protein n=1 Tax=Parerythrobacter lacustris TaxID=2969984 RepID=A0ABT1XRV9_9SPHN|nr:hypothetical protein [Parerythrobacter lacustris]MCR2833671.1 hypothetical protein [Parerythrobacter lacustris]
MQEFEAALDWWRLAGVDTDFADDVTDWLATPEAEATAPAPVPSATQPQRRALVPDKPRVAIGGERAGWPTDLSAFHRWWLESDTLDAGGSFPRIAPRGLAGAELMVVVPEPEEVDRETLMSGPEGKLLAGFLAAAGLGTNQTYLAAALPRHTPLPEWDRLKADGLGDLLAHHVALAAPNRIIAFGRNILPLLGHDTAQAAATLRVFNHDGVSVPLMAAPTLGELLRSAGRRKQLWQRWLDWTEG